MLKNLLNNKKAQITVKKVTLDEQATLVNEYEKHEDKLESLLYQSDSDDEAMARQVLDQVQLSMEKSIKDDRHALADPCTLLECQYCLMTIIGGGQGVDHQLVQSDLVCLMGRLDTEDKPEGINSSLGGEPSFSTGNINGS